LGAAGVIFSDRLAEIWYGRDWTEPSAAWMSLFHEKDPPAAKAGREPKVENAVLITPSAPPVIQEQPRRLGDVRPAAEAITPAPASSPPGSTASLGVAPTSRDLPWLPEAENRAESLQSPPARPPARVAVAAPELAPLPTPAPLPPAPAPAPTTAASPPRAATISLPAAEVAELIRRARGHIELGDIAGARLLLERAASGNEPSALMALAETYDPTMLAKWGARGLRADPNKARALYLKAAERGIAEAKARILALR